MREGVTGSLPAEWWGFCASKMSALGAMPEGKQYAELGGVIDLAQAYQRKVGLSGASMFGDTWCRRQLPPEWFHFLAEQIKQCHGLIAAHAELAQPLPWIEQKIQGEVGAALLALDLSCEFDQARCGAVAP